MIENVNKTTLQDILYAVTKAAVGSIPLVGSAASELLGLIVAPPIENRRKNWMTEIGLKLKKLEEAGRLNIDDLATNEQFIDTVLQATTFALRTSDKEKISALKNAIINTALGEAPNLTLSHIFLNLVNDFTIWHIKILHLFNNPIECFANSNKPTYDFDKTSLITILFDAFPTLSGQIELLDLIWADLKRAHLHLSNEMMSIKSIKGFSKETVTDLGKQLLKYISEDGQS